MSTVEKFEGITKASPLFKARMGGFFWLITILAGSAALYQSSIAANFIAIASYLVATVFVYLLLKPVSRTVSMLAAFFSLIGCVFGTLIIFHFVPAYFNPLVFFGLHCLGVGYLVFNSTFMPRFVGALMMFGGLGWLTFLVPPLAKYIAPYNLMPGMLGETTLTLWLLIKGVNVERWQEQAIAAKTLLRSGE